MATSSLKKSFYITDKNEIKKFAEMLMAKPQPLDTVKPRDYTQETLKEMINAEQSKHRNQK